MSTNQMIDFVENLRETYPDGVPDLGTPEFKQFLNAMNETIIASTPGDIQEFNEYGLKILNQD